MEKSDLLKRAEDLARRCETRGVLTHTGFLSPAGRYALEHDPSLRYCRLRFSGGRPDAERCIAFFLPDWMEELPEQPEEIRALRLRAAVGAPNRHDDPASANGLPSHRDYLGAVLGMGVGREWVGDILVDGATAIILCQPSVVPHLLSIERVGRAAVRAEEIALSEVPAPERKTEARSFTVQSPRLDAVAAGMFRLSRGEAARQIAAGLLSLNYEACLKSDAPIRAGDVLSLRGAGKGRVTELGGNSRKGRLFVTAELYR